MKTKKFYLKLFNTKTLTTVISLWLCIGMFCSVQADTSSSSDVRNNKFYGNCRVWTQVDMLTDEESHHLSCKEETITDETEIVISQWSPGKLELRLSKGVMFHVDDYIPVAIRIDKGKLIKRKAWWSSDSAKYAYIDNRTTVTSVMNEMAKGKRVVIQVGSERGNVILKGSGAAVKDFKQRIK